jgi:hypothetical protein
MEKVSSLEGELEEETMEENNAFAAYTASTYVPIDLIDRE